MDLPFKPGDRLADVRLGSMGGTSKALSDYAGRKKLVYVWASWCGCREQLGALQAFQARHPGLPIITIACDVQGPDHPMRYLRQAKATYEMWIDATCLLSRRWGLKQVSVLVLLDEANGVMFTGSKPDAAFLEGVEKLLSKPPPANPPAEPKVDSKNTRIEILMQSCANFLSRKRIEDAVGALLKALALDPDNKIIPKQVWALRNPEKFYSGPIDKEWQAQQPPVKAV